jgi:iron complex outermembrane receptor protein
MAAAAPCHADSGGSDSELESELRFLAAERQTVVTASKVEERVEKTISTTSTITQADIRQVGARNLLDVLRLVLGIGVTQSAFGAREVEVRGVKSLFSEKVLFLLNGHPLDQNLQVGGATLTYDDLPVDTIKRVEVVRGPGSALYGANAFLAVINIITLGAEDVDGVQASAGWGSFDLQQYRASAGKRFDNGAQGVLHFNFADTNGIGTPVPEDALTAQGLPSLAPGNSQLTETRYDLEWQLGYEGFKLDGRFIHKRDGAFVGPNFDLSDQTRQNYDNYFIRLSHVWNLSDRLAITTQAYHDYFDFDNLLQTQPDQFFRAALNDTRTGAEVQGTFRWAPNNTLIGGVSYAKEQQDDVSQQMGSSPQDLGPFLPFSKNIGRDHWGLYFQDIWDPFASLRLTLGARYDEYSRFGGTFNPRLGFNWEFVKDYSLKFSYGTAFRAPAFGELSLINNPAFEGNPSLEPEEIETFEAGIIAHPVTGLTTQAVFYHSHIGKIIALSPVEGKAGLLYQNIGSLLSEGVEIEARYDFGGDFAGSYLAANYVYQNPKTQDGQQVPDVPRDRANLMLNWAFDSHWSGFASVLLKGQTGRAAGDLRGDVPGYAVANLSLLGRRLYWDGADLSFTVYNLLDSKYFDPAPFGMPVNYQQSGRAFFGHVSFKF